MQAGLHSLDSRDSGTADLSEFPTLPCGMRSVFLRGQEFRQKNSAALRALPKDSAQAPFLYQDGWSFFILFLLKTVIVKGVPKLTQPRDLA